MAYMGELGAGSSLYIDNQGDQTIVTAVTQSPGQQQHISHSMTTGAWTTSPGLFRSVQGAVIQLKTAHRDYYIQVQNHQIRPIEAPHLRQTLESIPLHQVVQTQTRTPPMAPMSPMIPMAPMAPLPPMENMAMDLPPMPMRMGNMQMSTGSAATTSTAQHRQFCSQCGTAVEATDKFCADCGHRLR